MTEQQLRNRKWRDLLHWGTLALFLLSNVLNVIVQQRWTLLLFVACTLIWIVALFITIQIEHRATVRQYKAWKQQDALFLATLENMQMVAQSDMDDDEKRQALLYLHQQYQKTKGA